MLTYALVLGALWLVFALVANRAVALSTRGDVLTGITLLFLRFYARVVHRMRVEGLEHVPDAVEAGPLVVVSNHTAGVDPLLIQAACRFEVRWIMAEDMRLPWLEAFWEWGGVIFVDRENPSTSPVRMAMTHLRAGGVLGLFPEGHIERPARTLLPFHAGVGAFVRPTGAAVLPVVIEGTPTRVRSAWGSLFTPSRARLTFHEPIRYGRELSPAEIAEDLQKRYLGWTGWPAAGRSAAYAEAKT